MRSEEHYTLSVQPAWTEQALQTVAAVEAEVFGEVFGNTAEQLAAEYGAFIGSTVCIVVSADGVPVGAMRLLLGDETAMPKTLADASAAPWHVNIHEALRNLQIDQASIIDVATFAVVNRYRKTLAAPLIINGLIQVAYGGRRTHATAVLDSAVLAHLAAMGIKFSTVGNALPAPYLGSPSSVPVIAHRDELVAGMQGAGTWDFLGSGVTQLPNVTVDFSQHLCAPHPAQQWRASAGAG